MICGRLGGGGGDEEVRLRVIVDSSSNLKYNQDDRAFWMKIVIVDSSSNLKYNSWE